MSIADLRKGRFSSIGYDYFVTFNTKNRKPYFNDSELANILAKTIHYHNGISLFAWVIIPDHVHMLFNLEDGTLSGIIQSIKANSSRKIRALRTDFRWGKGFYDHGLRYEEQRIEIARYIVANPLRAKLVTRLADYTWWNAIYV